MISELCQELNNWFDEKSDGTKNRYFGSFVISQGMIDLSEIDIKSNQYFRIVGSAFNDGVHKYPTSNLTDEVFDGAVWVMSIPKEVLNLAKRIEDWSEKYLTADSVAMSPFTSESFGGYSYSKSSGSGGNGEAQALSWQRQFQSSLNKWRKIRP